MSTLKNTACLKDVGYLLYKQGLHRTQKLRQRTNWAVNLRISKLAKAQNQENWSVQLIHPADLSCWHFAYCTQHIITCKVHMLLNAHVTKCKKLHHTHCILPIASYTLQLTQRILHITSYTLSKFLKPLFKKSLKTLFQKSLKHRLI